MLAVIRIILLALAIGVISIISIISCLVRPFHRNNVHFAAGMMGSLHKLLGLKIEIRIPEEVKHLGSVVYIANHQNNFDIFTIANAVQPGTVSVGKKSLKWIPFFGQMYWLTGNILIDRKNTSKAMGTIALTAEKIKEKRLSVWLFPEGTRSYGRGLLPFKTGAFRTAALAGVPVVPICSSNQHGSIKLNRWNNGKIIIEFLPPVEVLVKTKEEIRALANQVRENMANKLEEISTQAGSHYPTYQGK
ncbi:1-acylglycerol-3-phosphate O-acyltransferase [Thalassotalea sp. LPB0316]|uniref:1-acylglycerol-3-phosphate O-acyltransferase n=1 Tax=Thalassotalea sp. LPB0316 TaxID=2769490 RepID=UPI001867C5A8|nr:1-acylglycerol-3-phosphate O-acyltransferase [Thalassotalea sp. LPB0316]QOL26798.1 1-acylglycerol-3-phosphate O-acyltransferase [Thalassotalea sp. LPB0316]